MYPSLAWAGSSSKRLVDHYLCSGYVARTIKKRTSCQTRINKTRFHISIRTNCSISHFFFYRFIIIKRPLVAKREYFDQAVRRLIIIFALCYQNGSFFIARLVYTQYIFIYIDQPCPLNIVNMNFMRSPPTLNYK